MNREKRNVKHRTTLGIAGVLLMMVALSGCKETDGDDLDDSIAATTHALATELISNGAFSNGATGWFLGQWGGSSSGTVTGGKYKITVTTAGSAWWNVQFMQRGLPLEQGKRYVFSFDAYKGTENSGTQSMVVNVGEDGGDYTSYMNGNGPQATLTTAPTRYSYTFEMTEPDDSAARVEFNCGLNKGTFYIDNVSLMETEGPFAIDPASVALTAAPTETVTSVITIDNPSSSAVSWSANDDASWLSVSPSGGTVSAGSQATVTLSANTQGLGIGTYAATVTFVHDSESIPSPLVIDVNLQVRGSYQPESPYLRDPDLAIPFVEDIAAFRLKAKDNVNGGFYSFINRNGTPTSENTKSLCVQSRLGYAFTRAFALTGNEAYLDHAHHALKFLYDHGWNNGWYFATNIQGGYISHWGHDNWWSFQQHYALVGITAMVEVTGGNTNWGDGSQTDSYWLNTGVNSNYTKLWDSNPATEGYFNYASRNWSTKWGKGFTPTVDGITTHALLLAAMTDDPTHDQRLFDLADNALDHMVGAMPNAALGFPELFDANWNIDTSQTTAEPGHHYKTAWCLYRAYLMDPSRIEYKNAADAIMWDMWNNGGYDRLYGGPYSTVNWQTGVVTNTGKTNWMLEQGTMAGLIGYHSAASQADRDMFLEVADGSTNFFMDHQIDSVYGEAYAEVNRAGSAATIADKGGLFNAGYHSIEMAYYIYLYGNLFLHQRPVHLYYRFPASNAENEIRLTPIAVEDDLLKIAAVELDGAPYSNFDADDRTLSLPAGVGGVFRVTFTVGGPGSCGDGSCTNGETCASCEADCGQCEFCGDGMCNNGETCASCEADCGPCELCGNGTCDVDEDCSTCAADCGQCQYCGDGTCNNGEDCATCTADCGQCQYCGDGTCNNGEDCATCAADCGQCASRCTCPSGCNSLVKAAVPTVVDGVNNKCYFFSSLGSYINNWNNAQVNINGVNITNAYMGSWSFPAKIDSGYYIYHKGNYAWSHLEVK